MADTLMMSRFAAAQLEAGLMIAGFSKENCVLVRLSPNANENEFFSRLLPGDGDVALRNSQPLTFVSMSGKAENEPTHAKIDVEAMQVPDQILSRLKEFHDSLSADPDPLGWVLAVRPDGGILMRLCSSRSTRQRVQLERYAAEFSTALGLPVRLEMGMLSQQAQQVDRWAHDEHSSVNPGLNIGTNIDPSVGGTLTTPVKPIRSIPGRQAEPHTFLTCAHIFHIQKPIILPATKAKVRQPQYNANPDALAGSLQSSQYDHRFYAKNFFDACLFSTDKPPSYQFGRDLRHAISGVWENELTANTKMFIYGSTSGFIPVKLEYNEVTSVLIRSNDGIMIDYRDVVEFSNDRDDRLPATTSGDSGAPLLVQSNRKYYLAGMVVGGGVRRGEKRKPKSYAIPIKRILDQMGVELW
jgi:hypothetical protein